MHANAPLPLAKLRVAALAVTQFHARPAARFSAAQQGLCLGHLGLQPMELRVVLPYQLVDLLQVHQFLCFTQITGQLPLRRQLSCSQLVQLDLALFHHQAGGLQAFPCGDDFGIGFDDFIACRFATFNPQADAFAHLFQQQHIFGSGSRLRLVQQTLVNPQTRLADQFIAGLADQVLAFLLGGSGSIDACLPSVGVFNGLADRPALEWAWGHASDACAVLALMPVDSRIGQGACRLNSRTCRIACTLGCPQLRVVRQDDRQELFCAPLR